MLYLNKILALYFLFLLIETNAQSWQKIPNPEWRFAPLKFAVDAENGDILAVSYFDGSGGVYSIYFSTDNGNTWQKKKNFTADRQIASLADVHIHSRTKRWYLGFDNGFIWFSRDKGEGFTKGSSDPNTLTPPYVYHLDESSLGDGMLWHLGSAPDGFNFSPQLAAEALESNRTVAMKDGSNLAVGYHASEQKSGVFKASPGGSVLFSELRQWNQQYHKNCKPVWGKTYVYHDIQLDSAENIYCLINTRLNIVDKSNNTIYDIDSLLPKQEDFYPWLENLNFNKVDKKMYVLRNGILYSRKKISDAFIKIPTEYHILEYHVLKNGSLLCGTRENGMMLYDIKTTLWSNINFETKKATVSDFNILGNGSLMITTNGCNGQYIKNELWQDWDLLGQHFDTLKNSLCAPYYVKKNGEIISKTTGISTQNLINFNNKRSKGFGQYINGPESEMLEFDDMELHFKYGGRILEYYPLKDSWAKRQFFDTATIAVPFPFGRGRVKFGKNNKMYLTIGWSPSGFGYYETNDTFKTMKMIVKKGDREFIIGDKDGDWYLKYADSLFYSTQEGDSAVYIKNVKYDINGNNNLQTFGDTVILSTYAGKNYIILNGVLIDSLQNNYPSTNNLPEFFTKFYKYKTGEYLGVTPYGAYLYTKRNLAIPNPINASNVTFKLNVYPNPANDEINFNYNNLETACIYSILGEKILEFKTTLGSNTINVSYFQNGLYILKIKDKYSKFIIAQ